MTEREIFAQALELPAAEERADFLDRACEGNAALRERVERLLVEQESLGSYLEVPVAAVAVATVDHPARTRPGLRIGRYRLLEQIGEGGMGTVWVAEQTEPVKRRVALKLIKPGMDSRQVLSRFEAERQALALMDHPNIAKVFDGGMTDEGRPYFVMEYVKGVPITEYCDQRRALDPERLKLFLPVCQAVQHAHQKGIIHRDLKPSNILVCLYDGQPVPKVIDFGLAKAISQPLTEHTLYTAHGLMVGTPLYMSPEQAEFNNLDVDTRTDIYSLGVILYELLTGTHAARKAAIQRRRLSGNPPADQRSRAAQAQHEAQQQRQPPRHRRPAQPRTRPAQPPRPRRPRLDRHEGARKGPLPPLRNRQRPGPRHRAISLRRTDRGRAAVAELSAAKVHEEAPCPRFACPHGHFSSDWWHRCAPVLTIVLVIFLLVSGIIGTSIGMIRAMHAEADAKEQRNKAQAAATASRKAMEAAESREAETKVVLNFVESKILAAARPEGQDGGLGREITLRQAVDTALPFVDRTFANQPLIEARLRMTLGNSYRYLGEAQIASEQHQAARATYLKHLGPDHLDTLQSMLDLADSYRYLGRHAEALKLCEETFAMRTAKLGRDHLDTLASMHALATIYWVVGRYAEELQLREEVLALTKTKLGPDAPATIARMMSLGNTYSHLGRYVEALKLHELSLALAKIKFGPHHPSTLACRDSLARSNAFLGQYADSIKLHQENLVLNKAQLGPDHPHTLNNMNNLTWSYYGIGRTAEGLELAKENLALRKAKFGPDHPDTIGSMMNVALGYAHLGRHTEALKLREESLTLRTIKLGPDHPKTLSAMSQLSDSYADVGRHTDALKLREQTLALCKTKLAPNHPDTLLSMHSLATSYAKLGRHTEALQLYRETAQLWLDLNRTDAASLHTAARLRAATAAVIRAADPSEAAAKEANAEADRAMDWLQKAVATGYINSTQLARDKDLDSLRSRDDFQKLQAALEAGQKKDFE